MRKPKLTPQPPSAANAQAQQAADLGQRLRSLRKSAGLTLTQASAANGVSRAALSKIERSEMSPTYDSLCKLAAGYEMDLAALISGRRQNSGGFAITRANGGASQKTERYHHRLQAPQFAERGLFAFISDVLAQRLDEYDAWDTHDSEDFVYLLSGSVEMHLHGHDKIELYQGDSLQMDGRIPHAIIARPPVSPPPRLLWISRPHNR